ncbi:MAG: hypothetical protein IPM66_22290 [Acidobacteriota bacterium]|nr:MAG: hypothetical protein IPM66_22290 [Acidobacteriota bacterium]
MPSITEINYELHILSDLHIGSGVGLPGVIDEHVVRDHEGFAFAPFSEIKGLVRDSCASLMSYLGCRTNEAYACEGQRKMFEVTQADEESQLQGEQPQRRRRASPAYFCGLKRDKLCILCYLFGSAATPARWWFSPASYCRSYKDTVLNFADDFNRSLARRDSTSSAHASINPLSKRAAENHLYNLEVVRLPPADAASQQRLIWEGQIQHQPPAIDTKKAEGGDEWMFGWLIASLLFTRRIGGRRRRGWGQCRFVLPAEINVENLLDEWINKLKMASLPE